MQYIEFIKILKTYLHEKKEDKKRNRADHLLFVTDLFLKRNADGTSNNPLKDLQTDTLERIYENKRRIKPSRAQLLFDEFSISNFSDALGKLDKKKYRDLKNELKNNGLIVEGDFCKCCADIYLDFLKELINDKQSIETQFFYDNLQKSDNNFIGRTEDIQRIVKKIKESPQQIDISGDAGIGKSQLMIRVGETLNNEKIRTCRIICESYTKNAGQAFINAVSRLEFQDSSTDERSGKCTEDKFVTKINHLKKNYDVLIVDNWDFNKSHNKRIEEIDTELQKIKKTNTLKFDYIKTKIKIVFVSRTKTKDSIHIDSLSLDNCRSIITPNANHSYNVEELEYIDKIIEHIKYNTKGCCLIASLLSETSVNPRALLRRIENSDISELDKTTHQYICEMLKMFFASPKDEEDKNISFEFTILEKVALKIMALTSEDDGLYTKYLDSEYSKDIINNLWESTSLKQWVDMPTEWKKQLENEHFKSIIEDLAKRSILEINIKDNQEYYTMHSLVKMLVEDKDFFNELDDATLYTNVILHLSENLKGEQSKTLPYTVIQTYESILNNIEQKFDKVSMALSDRILIKLYLLFGRIYPRIGEFNKMHIKEKAALELIIKKSFGDSYNKLSSINVNQPQSLRSRLTSEEKYELALAFNQIAVGLSRFKHSTISSLKCNDISIHLLEKISQKDRSNFSEYYNNLFTFKSNRIYSLNQSGKYKEALKYEDELLTDINNNKFPIDQSTLLNREASINSNKAKTLAMLGMDYNSKKRTDTINEAIECSKHTIGILEELLKSSYKSGIQKYTLRKIQETRQLTKLLVLNGELKKAKELVKDVKNSLDIIKKEHYLTEDVLNLQLQDLSIIELYIKKKSGKPFTQSDSRKFIKFLEHTNNKNHIYNPYIKLSEDTTLCCIYMETFDVIFVFYFDSSDKSISFELENTTSDSYNQLITKAKNRDLEELYSNEKVRIKVAKFKQNISIKTNKIKKHSRTR